VVIHSAHTSEGERILKALKIEFYNCPICGVGIGNDVDGTVEHKCKEEKEYAASFQTNDMPTLPQKLEAIRAVCVKANPRKKWSVEPYRTGDTECFGYNLPVLLSDVLLAMNKKLDKWASRSWNSVIASWNLLRPSLDDQDEPTVNLIYEILK
jgi:hypothetical protein